MINNHCIDEFNLSPYGCMATLCICCIVCIFIQVLIHQRTPVELWAPGYTAGWVLQRLCLLLLQCRIAYATATSFRNHRHEVESLKANRHPDFQGLHR